MLLWWPLADPSGPRLDGPDETAGLILRPFQRADAAVFATEINTLLAEPATQAALLTFPKPFTCAQARARIAQTHRWLRQDQGWSLAVERHGQLIGQAQLVCTYPSKRVGEIAYWIARGHQGQGYGYRSVARLLKAAAHHWPLERVEATVVAHNQASIGLLTSLGFALQGSEPVPYRVQGQWRRRHAELLIYARPMSLLKP